MPIIPQNTPLYRFKSGFRWNLLGSSTFELLKVLHNILLLQLISPTLYGTIGSTFAFIFLISRFVDSGTALAIPPFFTLMTESKSYFKHIFFRYYFFPLVIPGILIAFTGIFVYSHKFTQTKDSLPLIILILLIFLEAIRSLMRQFLHTAFKNKQAIFSELFLFLGYLAIVWGAHLCFSIKLSLNLIFIPFLLDSIIALIIFTYMTHTFYRKLPDAPTKVLPDNLSYRIFSTRGFNFLLKTSRDLFTSNFITPLFAVKFGLIEAGVFYFASTIATSLQAIVKASISYPASALLAHIKENPEHSKQQAFREMTSKLALIVVPLLIFIIINYHKIIALRIITSPTSTTVTFSLLYLVIIFSEFFFLLYEQFYIIEEAARTLCFFKLFEFILFFSTILANKTTSPVITLLSIMGVRLISFCVITLHAYFRWRIRPRFNIRISYAIFWLILSWLVTVML